MVMIQEYTEEHVVSWKESITDFPFPAHTYTLREKQTREKIFEQYIDSAKALKEGKPLRKELTEKEEQLFVARTGNLLRDGLDFTDRYIR
ncbi:MAG TPA: hypothetical protein VK470_00475 [Bacteroidota bacterium]|nr:hypothetical protein [Bacteroidota bacterium]